MAGGLIVEIALRVVVDRLGTALAAISKSVTHKDFGCKYPHVHVTRRGRQFTSIMVLEPLTVKASAAQTEHQRGPAKTLSQLYIS